MTTVFCDESGFSGNNLWDSQQPHFAFAGIQTDEEAANDLLEEAKNRFQIRHPEIHAARMLRKESGHEAILWILEQIASQSSVIYVHKRYALAGKMFEYLMEPIISENSYPFYQTGFHKFWANLVFLNLLVNLEKHSQVFQVFQKMMRELDGSILQEFLESIPYEPENEPLNHVVNILVCNQKRIVEEITSSRGADGVAAWLLDLSFTSVQSVLTFFSGPEMEPISLICDDSKPLKAAEQDLNDIGLLRKEFVEIELDGRRCPVTFSLAEEVSFGSSKEWAGLQLADVAASSTVYALKHPTSNFTRRWNKAFSKCLHENCIVPDMEELNLSSERSWINARILGLLSEQSIRGECLVRNSNRTIAIARGV